MVAGRADAPAIVDDDVLFDGGVVVEPGEELLGLPVVDGAGVAVGPDQVRLVQLHQLVELGGSLQRNIGMAVVYLLS